MPVSPPFGRKTTSVPQWMKDLAVVGTSSLTLAPLYAPKTYYPAAKRTINRVKSFFNTAPPKTTPTFMPAKKYRAIRYRGTWMKDRRR